MRLIGKLTAVEWEGACKLARSKWAWPLLLLKNLYRVVLLGAILWATISAAISGGHGHWRGIATVWLVIGGIIAWAVFSTLRSSRKNLAALNATAPDWIDLDGSGLRTWQSNGATSFQPWESFKRWRSAESVILLDLAASKRVTILPLTALSVSERDVLRGLVASHLGAEKSNSALLR